MKNSVPIDFAKLASQLRSSNSAPVTRGGIAKFGANFDFDEQVRIGKAIRVLIIYADVALPELIAHAGSDEYCCTIGFGYGATNFSVGAVCRLIVQNNLEEPYRGRLPTEVKNGAELSINQQLGLAMFEKDDFIKWLEDNSRKDLKELQKLSLLRLDRLINEMSTSDGERATLRGIVADVSRSISSQKTARLSSSLLPGREHWQYHSREDAERHSIPSGR